MRLRISHQKKIKAAPIGRIDEGNKDVEFERGSDGPGLREEPSKKVTWLDIAIRSGDRITGKHGSRLLVGAQHLPPECCDGGCGLGV